MGLEKELKDAIRRVNCTLNIYEPNYISCQRTAGTEKEVCYSFEQFVEIRFNKECEKIPELKKLIEETEGHLFLCTSIDEPNMVRRRFKVASLVLIDPDMIEDVEDSMREAIDEVEKLLGGRTITFNSVKKKIKFRII